MEYFFTNPVSLRSLSARIGGICFIVLEDAPDGLPGDEDGHYQHQQHAEHAEDVVSPLAAWTLQPSSSSFILLPTLSSTYRVLRVPSLARAIVMDPVCERPDVLRVIRLLVAALVLGVEGAHEGPVTDALSNSDKDKPDIVPDLLVELSVKFDMWLWPGWVYISSSCLPITRPRPTLRARSSLSSLAVLSTLLIKLSMFLFRASSSIFIFIYLDILCLCLLFFILVICPRMSSTTVFVFTTFFWDPRHIALSYSNIFFFKTHRKIFCKGKLKAEIYDFMTFE